MSTEFADFAQQRWRYDVFLSFRGEDTRRNFTSHLYYPLEEYGFNVFMDDTELPRGKDISSQLTEAIRNSRMSVIVFSGSYASSRWCLQELGEILECMNSIGQIVLPVFYDIDPSNVRRQSGSFEKAFMELESKAAGAWRAFLRSFPLFRETSTSYDPSEETPLLNGVFNVTTQKQLTPQPLLWA
ncbi:TMV resistance protein N-like [Punica granatum]|uniref:ADP-ribosyl cyclase/cyclic ADP-ribose hydrolase n=1 Tax=Punica granatum TaxID=22663 RepID=A0A6P8DVL4_PUNGR|nr:TMV resistance protein N-like [Punica granatum]